MPGIALPVGEGVISHYERDEIPPPHGGLRSLATAEYLSMGTLARSSAD